jgi:hypothetical protein
MAQESGVEIVLIVLLLMLVGVIATFYAIRINRSSEEQWEKWWKEQREERTRRKTEEVQEGIETWLLSLRSPQLARQKQRKESARQLSIVLIEKLLEMPSLHQISTEDRKPKQSNLGLNERLGNKAISQKRGQPLRQRR